jgi:hypothetical protein
MALGSRERLCHQTLRAGLQHHDLAHKAYGLYYIDGIFERRGTRASICNIKMERYANSHEYFLKQFLILNEPQI